MSLLEFILKINNEIGITIPENWRNEIDEITLARKFLMGINEYFFQTYNGIGILKTNEQEFQYFSEFHKYWESHHVEIINGQIDRTQSRLVAGILHQALVHYGEDIFAVTSDTHGLPVEIIAQIRFFTANQDFRTPPKDQYNVEPNAYIRYSAETIVNDPSSFIGFIGMSSQAQNDKRIDFARNAARFLIDRGINAYGIAIHFHNDAIEIRNAFLSNVGMGYGKKKIDMFLRDMFVLGVWPDLINMDLIDVASDQNTMKLALRTGILKTDISLLSSFLDIFGYQYGNIDKLSADAWRTVWEEWNRLEPLNAPKAPCMMDFLIYRIGREYCNDKLVEFICRQGHRFTNFGANLRKCPRCKSELTQIRRWLPCQVSGEKQPRFETGEIKLKPEDLLYKFDGLCIFESACRPNDDNFKKISPPKSISIIGRTGWTDSYANKEEGGGGMMG